MISGGGNSVKFKIEFEIVYLIIFILLLCFLYCNEGFTMPGQTIRRAIKNNYVNEIKRNVKDFYKRYKY